MPDVSVGPGGPEDGNENAVDKNHTPEKTFGEEGTNKTQPSPNPHATPSDVPGPGKHVNPSPYVR